MLVIRSTLYITDSDSEVLKHQRVLFFEVNEYSMQHLISIICSANSITELCPLSPYKCYDNYNINRLTCCLITSRGQISSWAAPLGEYKPFQLRRLVRRSPFATVKLQAEEKKHLNSLTPSGSHYTHHLSFHCACATMSTNAQPLEGAYFIPIILWRRQA